MVGLLEPILFLALFAAYMKENKKSSSFLSFFAPSEKRDKKKVEAVVIRLETNSPETLCLLAPLLTP